VNDPQQPTATAQPGAYESLSRPPGLITADQAAALTKQYYGLDAMAIPLEGERDSNFAVSTADGEKFMVKVIHPAESSQVSEGQTAVLLHLQHLAPELPVPRIVPGTQGTSLIRILEGPAKGRHMRMSTFVRGAALHTVASSPRLRTNLGRILAQLGQALRSFVHPATEEPNLWDIARLPELRTLIADIDDADKRARLLSSLDPFEEHVAPQLRTLRRQPVHNDFSGDNVLVDTDGVTISGIIDFGDMVNTQLVNDVAVAAAYQLGDDTDPTVTAVDVISGYQEVTPLTEEERAILFDLIIARMVTRLALTEWRAVRVAHNRDYILRNTARSWIRYDRLLTMSPNDFQKRITP
jgi:hydroxylysine kinase